MDYGRIGNYVHWHAENYRDYGIHMKEDGPSLLDNSMIDVAKTKLMNTYELFSIGEPDLKKLEQQLDWLKSPPETGAEYRGTGLTEKALNEGYQAFEEIAIQRFNAEVPPRIVRGKMNVKGIYEPGVHAIKTREGQKTITVTRIINNLNNLQKVINSATINNGYSEEDLQILSLLGIAIENALQDFVNETNTELGAAGCAKRISMDKAQPFIDIINTAVAYSTGVANAQRGDLWEDLIAAAAEVINSLGSKAIKENINAAINSNVKGSEKSQVQVFGNLFSEYADMGDILGSSYTDNKNGVYYSRHKTQDKVDVVLEWDGTNINISAKNVALSGTNPSQVKIVEAMSLLIGLGNLGNPSLATHYINQHVSPNVVDGSLYKDTAALVKLSLIEQGLRGYKEGAEKADYFIINDNANGRTIIISMMSLLYKIGLNFPDFSQYASFKDDPLSISLTKANEFNEASYQARITNILKQVHNTKITIHLKPAVFDAKISK